VISNKILGATMCVTGVVKHEDVRVYFNWDEVPLNRACQPNFLASAVPRPCGCSACSAPKLVAHSRLR
jgi:hypothetical protein